MKDQDVANSRPKFRKPDETHLPYDDSESSIITH